MENLRSGCIWSFKNFSKNTLKTQLHLDFKEFLVALGVLKIFVVAFGVLIKIRKPPVFVGGFMSINNENVAGCIWSFILTIFQYIYLAGVGLEPTTPGL